ncbi:uncharacterized protein [Drosophila kikkawai]|uniref:Uncharacterized protein n=1 Tax=Drosophila kikkawai TaxID=30033 RepID=A0ABM4GEB4_DROKI
MHRFQASAEKFRKNLDKAARGAPRTQLIDPSVAPGTVRKRTAPTRMGSKNAQAPESGGEPLAGPPTAPVRQGKSRVAHIPKEQRHTEGPGCSGAQQQQQQQLTGWAMAPANQFRVLQKHAAAEGQPECPQRNDQEPAGPSQPRQGSDGHEAAPGARRQTRSPDRDVLEIHSEERNEYGLSSPTSTLRADWRTHATDGIRTYAANNNHPPPRAEPTSLFSLFPRHKLQPTASRREKTHPDARSLRPPSLGIHGPDLSRRPRHPLVHQRSRNPDQFTSL